MRLCIPVGSNEGLGSPVYGHFGSAPYFLLVDMETSAFEVIVNGDSHHAHGMCQPLKALAGKAVDAVVTGGIGIRALSRLQDGGTRVFKAQSGTAHEVMANYRAGSLEELSATTACRHHDCAGHHGAS